MNRNQKLKIKNFCSFIIERKILIEVIHIVNETSFPYQWIFTKKGILIEGANEDETVLLSIILHSEDLKQYQYNSDEDNNNNIIILEINTKILSEQLDIKNVIISNDNNNNWVKLHFNETNHKIYVYQNNGKQDVIGEFIISKTRKWNNTTNPKADRKGQINTTDFRSICTSFTNINVPVFLSIDKSAQVFFSICMIDFKKFINENKINMICNENVMIAVDPTYLFFCSNAYTLSTKMYILIMDQYRFPVRFKYHFLNKSFLIYYLAPLENG